MLQWQVTVQTEDGPIRLQGQAANPKQGACEPECNLPEGTLTRVAAYLPWYVSPEEKIFQNGYQTWTFCPEYSTEDKIRGLHGVPEPIIRQYGLDRYGDYHFVDYPNQAGVTHGFSWCTFRKGDKFRLIGSLDETDGYTLFTYNSNIALITIERDCAGVSCGGPFRPFRLWFAEGTLDEVYDSWFAAMGIPKAKARPLAGYSSWYNRYANILDESIRADLAGCQGILQPGDLFQIDDGWEPAVGDWLEADGDKFPEGMQPLAEAIHSSGYLAGLWLAPFVCQSTSKVVTEHPDWLLQVNGAPWSLGSNWGGFYSLDIDHPGVQDYLRRVFHRVLDEWGFDLVKLDFLYGAAPFGTAAESRAGRMIRAMDFLREVCGDKLILGCGVPVMPAFGRVDYCRISCDVSLDWDDKPYMRVLHRERVSTKQAIGNTISRRALDGRAWGSDPDVFFLRDENLSLTYSEKLLLARVNALLGTVFLTSDNLSNWNEAQKKDYQELRHLCAAENVRWDPAISCICYTLDGAERTLPVPPGIA